MTGERIKLIRKKSGLTQTEFGKIFGIGKTTVSSYEIGNSVPNDNIKISMCKHFNVSLDYLLGLTDDPTPSNQISVSPTKDTVKTVLFGEGTDVTDEMWKELTDYAGYVKYKYCATRN